MAEHIKQNDSGLYLSIQQIGCFFRSACLLAEIRTGKSLTVHQLNSLWDKSKTFGYIDENDNVKTSAYIANIALRELGDKGCFKEVGVFRDGVLNWYAGFEHKATDYIQKVLQNGKSRTHFRVVSAAGELIEDPHRPAINVQGILYTICYRYFEGVKNV